MLNIEVLPWKSIFFLNIPFAAAALIGAAIHLPESRDPHAPPPDIPGVILSTLGLFTLVYAIIHAGEAGWTHATTFLTLGVAALLITAFLLWENYTSHPMLPLYFFRNMSFSATSISMTMTLFTLLGVLFFLPQFFQGIQQYSPLQTGFLMLPKAVVGILAPLLSQRLAGRFGTKRMILSGSLLGAGGVLLLALVLNETMPYYVFLLGFALTFTGVDSAMPASTMVIMQSIPAEKAGIGSAMNNMTNQIGSALGIAVLGSVVNRTYLQHIAGLEQPVPAGLLAQIQRSIFSARAALLESSTAQSLQLLADANAGFISGVRTAFITGSIVLALSTLLVARLLPEEVERVQLRPAAEHNPSASAGL